MVVGPVGPGGDFVLPEPRPTRILFVSGGSGITPVMSMLRTLRAEGYAGEIAFVHYARTPEEACYRAELAAHAGIRVLHGYTRSPGGELTGHFDADHLRAAMGEPDAVFVCGPPALAEAVRARLRQRQLRKLRTHPVRRPRRTLGRPDHVPRQRQSKAPMTADRCSSRPRPPV